MDHAQLPAYSYPLFLPPFSDASSQLVAWIEIPTFFFEIQATSLCHPVKKNSDWDDSLWKDDQNELKVPLFIFFLNQIVKFFCEA